MSHTQTTPDILTSKIEKLLSQKDQITTERKKELEQLATTIYKQRKEMGFSKVTYICTHNSRRSQLSQVWFWKALQYFDISDISSYSGGTEGTAFNHRMVSALERFGFDFIKLDESDNPKYLIRAGKADEREMVLFSKKYADSFNPTKNFIAVMVCGQADEDCPLVFGAYSRISLPYVDPKLADDTPAEAETYDDKVLEIGREILYLVQHLKTLQQ